MGTKLIYLFCFCIAVCNQTFSQKQAYSTINGMCWQYFETGCDSPYANMVLKFNDDSLEQIIEPLNLNLALDYSRAAFSDTNGNLLFASNGWRLINSNGSILSYKLWRDEMPHPADSPESTMVLVTMGPLFLNDPGDSGKAYLFYGEYQSFDDPPFTLGADTYFSYAYLDISTQSLISQNNTILNTPTQKGNMQACRHANGRDWWIIKPGIRENKSFLGLLDPIGVEFQEITLSDVPDRTQANTFSQFSFDGTRFVHFTGNPNRILYTFDFDRCSGQLSNMVSHDLSDSLRAGDLNAFTLSPDGSKVYIKKGNYFSQPQQVQGVLQYDLNLSLYYYVTRNATAPQLTPNGKTVLIQSSYYQENNIIFTLSEIMNPNEFGVNCNFNEHKYTTQNTLNFIMPSNYANFRLGALVGSGCDTLSTSVSTNITAPNLHLKIFPNPVESILTIEQDIPSSCEIKITDMFGRLQCQIKINSQKTVLTTEIEQLKSGIYWLEIQDLKTAKRAGKKFVKQ